MAWIHSAIVVKRLRDAGIPAWYWFIFGPGPFVLLLLAAEYLKTFWWVAVLAALAIFVAPAFFPSRTGIDNDRQPIRSLSRAISCAARR